MRKPPFPRDPSPQPKPKPRVGGKALEKRKPSPKKNLGKMVGRARDMKVDPMDYVRPSRAGGKAIGKKPYPPKDSPPRRRGPAQKIPKRPYDGPMIGPPDARRPRPKPFTGRDGKFPSKIIKPFKGPRIKRDDDLRLMGPRKKPNYTKPRGNSNAKYSIVPAKKKK
ncbi:unannotated protein [freshwater metagenome]|uniref:Unannotated protein n=1 Tax=freshwater metagenome TaxID=449393 RepID=A0A6J7BPJ5_9ZZZZ